MLGNGYIVRVDFYPEGGIIPLGITDKTGNTAYIQKIISMRNDENLGCVFDCVTDIGRCILTFKNDRWCIIFN